MSEQMREALTPSENMQVLLARFKDIFSPAEKRELQEVIQIMATAEKLEPVAWLEHSLEGDVIGVTLHPDGTWPTTPLYAAPVEAKRGTP